MSGSRKAELQITAAVIKARKSPRLILRYRRKSEFKLEKTPSAGQTCVCRAAGVRCSAEEQMFAAGGGTGRRRHASWESWESWEEAQPSILQQLQAARLMRCHREPFHPPPHPDSAAT